ALVARTAGDDAERQHRSRSERKRPRDTRPQTDLGGLFSHPHHPLSRFALPSTTLYTDQRASSQGKLRNSSVYTRSSPPSTVRDPRGARPASASTSQSANSGDTTWSRFVHVCQPS